MLPASLPFRSLSCQARMFVVSLCARDEDLSRLELALDRCDCCVSEGTAARVALHRLGAEDDQLGAWLSDLLDLRHVDIVGHVRSQSPSSLAQAWRDRARNASGDELAGWAWALCTDSRREVALLGQRMMTETYVRGLQALTATSLTDSSDGTRVDRRD